MVAESATRLLDGTGKGMDLTLVLGPMKSGKSLELVSQMSPLAYSNVTHRVYQSDRHMRDDQVTSRIGGSLQTIKTHSLLPLLDDEHVEVVGVDEIHMFDVTDITALAGLLERGTRVVATGIDLDHRGELFAPVRALFELGPQTVLHRRAVCDQCRQFNAVYTQVLAGGEPFTEQLAPSTPLPDDGTFPYEAPPPHARVRAKGERARRRDRDHDQRQLQPPEVERGAIDHDQLGDDAGEQRQRAEHPHVAVRRLSCAAPAPTSAALNGASIEM